MGSLKKPVLQKKQEAVSHNLFECDFCALRFPSKAQRTLHIALHFEKKSCRDCRKSLVRIDDDWYELHIADNCVKQDHSSASINGGIAAASLIQAVKEEEENFSIADFEIDAIPAVEILPPANCSIKHEFNNVKQNVNNLYTLPVKIEYLNVDQSIIDIAKLEIANAEPVEHNVTNNNQHKRPTKYKKCRINKNRIYIADLRPKDEPPTCDICQKTFNYFDSLRKHMKIQHIDGRNGNEQRNPQAKCTIVGCNRVAAKKIDLKCYNHTINKRKYTFHKDTIFNRDLRPKDQQLSCDICKKNFNYFDTLRKHIKRTHSKDNERFSCNVCPRTVSSYLKLINHMDRAHRIRENSPMQNVETHAEKQNNKKRKQATASTEMLQKSTKFKCIYTCDICSATLKSHANIKVHMSIHSGVKPHMCSYCGHRFGNPSNLRTHLNTHEQIKKFFCTYCPKAYANRTSWQRHKLVHTGEKPHKCTIDDCASAYIDKIDLKRHKFSAHGIYTKKHVCMICSKVYPENKLLRKHLESHQCSELF